MLKHVWLIGFLILAMAVMTGYATVTPYRSAGILLHQRGRDGGPLPVRDVGAPDERAHAEYVAYLLEHRALPVFDPVSPNHDNDYEFHQPPEFYLCAALWCKVAGADPRSPADGLKFRSLNILVGGLILFCVFQAGRIASGSADVGWLAMVTLFALPMFSALSAAVSNDPFLYLGCAGFLVGAAVMFQSGYTTRRGIAMAIAVGFAVAAKTTGLALIVPAIYVLWASRAKPNVGLIGPLALSGVFAIPTWVRNQWLYGDPFAARVFKVAFAETPQRLQMMEMVRMLREANGLAPGGTAADYWLNWVGWWTARSFFGAFGLMDIFYPDNLYRGLFLVSILIPIFAWRKKLASPLPQTFRITCWLTIGTVVILFLGFNWTYFQAQGRYLYPAIAPIVLLWTGCLASLSGAKIRQVTIAMFVIGLVANLATLQFLSGEFAKRVR